MNWKTVLLVGIIVASAVFSFVKIQSLGDETSHFNQTTRYDLGRYALLRSIFGLHKDGDARKAFIFGTSPLTIEIMEARDAELDAEALETFVEHVERYTGRSVHVIRGARVAAGPLSATDIATIAHRYRAPLFGETRLLVVYADDFESDGEEVGQTIEEFGMVLSHSRIHALTERFGRTTSSYISSTMLHEFGHQLGLGHIHDSACVMNDYVESPRSNRSATPSEFCRTELLLLEGIKDALR